MAGDVEADGVAASDEELQERTEELVSRRGPQSYEEGTRLWMVSTVQKRGMALAEVYRVQPTEGGTVVYLRAVEAVNGVREPFQKRGASASAAAAGAASGDVEADGVAASDEELQERTEELVSRRGPQSYEEGTRLWMVSTVQKRGMALAEVYRVQPTEGGTVVYLRAVEAVNGVREPFQKVVPHNQTHTPPHQQQASDGDGRLFRRIHRVGGAAVSSDETNTEAQHFCKAVCVGDGNKRLRVVGSPAGAGDGGGAVEDSNREQQQRIDTICSLVMECLPLHVLVPLSQRLAKSTKQMWEQAAPSHTRLFIDCATKGDEHCWRSPTEGRTFWQKIPLDDVKRMAARLTGLTHITLCHPEDHPMWCGDVLVTIIETTAAPPAPTQPPPATDQPGTQGEAPQRPSEVRQSASRLETIAFEEVRMSEAEGCELERDDLPLPPPLTEAPTLPSLKAITGAVHQHGDLADRGWLMPSVETVEQKGWRVRKLGRFVSSSRSLQHVGGRWLGERWASVFEHIPEAAAGQPGPLSQLQSIGDVLTSRGCHKSLTELHVQMPPLGDHTAIDSLLAVDSLVKECCTPDARITVMSTPGAFELSEQHRFDLSLFNADRFPSHPSRFFQMAIQTLVRQARQITYTISQHDLTHPIDSLSQAAIDIAKTLTFDNVQSVCVFKAYGFDPAPGAPSPHPAIIEYLQPFPRARELEVTSAVGGPAGQLLAEKMRREVVRVEFGRGVRAEDRRAVLEAMGAEREVGTVDVGLRGPSVSLTEGPLDGWRSDSFPSIGHIDMGLSLPDELEPSAAAERIRDGISSIVGGVRGLERLTVDVCASGAFRASIRQLLPTGTEVGDNFTIDTGTAWLCVESIQHDTTASYRSTHTP
ncbi:unnamed protein product [Vitrella brassicaformis CCMP3155]|uniref:Uncharacterized protein n=1 Tax=Vitrella brassicaformis (strain CCMP3155) TaxID=1169540 RepID=A0A0G4EIN3_VITBC|nr:unnamed protein product [Vitrella brassicaformis CCMP3155]|eukprot:CEL95752.1 unnamed protein product [Vitrella brassicaformis CCMP3155]